MGVILTTLDFINGLFSLLVISVGTIIGILIASKYFKYKRKIFLYWGIAYTGFYQPWWPSGISFLSVLIIGQTLPIQIYILLGNVFIPFFVILWMFGLTELLYEDKRKIIVLIYLIIFTVAEIYIIYYLFIDYTVLGSSKGFFDIKYKPIMLIYLLFINFSVTIMGLLVACQSIKSNEREVRIKGIFLIVAFITYPICGITDAGLDLTEVNLIIVRTILIMGAILFYIGFFMPRFIKKLFKLE